MKAEPLLRVEVESRSTPGKVYAVTQWRDEPLWRCGCPRHIFVLRKLGEDCKHIIAVKQTIKTERIAVRGQKIRGVIIREEKMEDKISPEVGVEKVLLRKLMID